MKTKDAILETIDAKIILLEDRINEYERILHTDVRIDTMSKVMRKNSYIMQDMFKLIIELKNYVEVENAKNK